MRTFVDWPFWLAFAALQCYGIYGFSPTNMPMHLSNRTDRNDTVRHSHSIHVASWNYDYVGKPLLITTFIVLVCAVKIILRHVHRLEMLIPESCLFIVLGIIIGFLLLAERAQKELAFLHFQSQSFFLYLLPPIILEAAYSLKDRAFVENFGAIMLYAVVGTILNVAIIGPALYGFSHLKLGFGMTLLECITFSALISAVDPVAVLAIFEEIGVNKMLYFMVFGESLFNDAVTVVIYNMMLSFMQADGIGFREVGLGLAAFICVSLGALVIGIVFGFLSAFITKHTGQVRMVEPVLFFGLAYLSYIWAEIFHFSGIISIITCGLIQSHYAADNISSKSYISVYYFAKVGSNLSESLIFVVLGVMLVNEYKSWFDFNVGFAVVSLVLCVAARFAVVFGLTYLVNKVVVSSRKIRIQEQFIMAYGGLRGAVTFSLAFMLDPHLLQKQEKTKNIMLTTAYIVIFFTTFLQGISIKPLIKFMRIRLETHDSNLFKQLNEAIIDNVTAGIEEIIGHRGSHYWVAMTAYLSNRFVRPVVQKFPHQKYSSFLAACQETQLQDRYATNFHHANSVTNQAALWTELDACDRQHLPHSVTETALDRQDQRNYQIRKERQSELKLNKRKLSELKFETPEELLTWRDLLNAGPHKKMHYVYDLDTGEATHQNIVDHMRRLSVIRHRANKPEKFLTVQNQLLKSAFLPLCLTFDHHQEQQQPQQQPQQKSEQQQTGRKAYFDLSDISRAIDDDQPTVRRPVFSLDSSDRAEQGESSSLLDPTATDRV